jgi:hypothetical protein
MTYHETVIDVIHHILSKGSGYLKMIDTRNAYDKLLRNYHQVNSNGEVVYRNNRAKSHYRFSVDAWGINDVKKCYYEHLIPVKLMKQELKALIDSANISRQAIAEILNKNEIVVLTRDEAKKMDKKHKSCLPDSGKDRVTEYTISIEPKTKDNSIFKNK